MKRFQRIIAFFAVLFLFSPTSAFADAKSQKKTEVRSLIEFEELATKRALELYILMEESWEEHADFEITASGSPFDMGDYYIVNSTFGSILVNKADLSVASVTMLIQSDSYDDDDLIKAVTNLFIAMSALEYDKLDEELLVFQNQFGLTDCINIVEKAGTLYVEEIMPYIEEILEEGSLECGEEVLVYSGNYNYYFSYYDLEPGEQIHSQVGTKVYIRAEKY